MNAIVPRDTIEQVAANRDAAIRLYEVAYDKIAVAAEAEREAADMVKRFGGLNSYNASHQDEIKAFEEAIRPPPRADYLRTARKLVDISAWSYIIERTDLERLMDREAKDKLRSQMAYVPDKRSWSDTACALITTEEVELGLPPFTVDNVYATIQQFAADADMIFRRGIANVFSKLDRRFRSHDGFKVGSRLILTNVFDVRWGGLNYGSIEDKLIDIERVFAVLDGRPQDSFTSAISALRVEHGRGFGGDGPRQSECVTPYFRIKGYKNGNAHLWFTRDDLVTEVNKLLAEWYGEVIGDGQTKEADPFADVKHLPARYFGFFPTPDRAAQQLFDGGGWRSGVYVLQDADKPQLRILEPSAGTGNLARRCVRSLEEAVRAVYGNDRHPDYLAEKIADYRQRYRWDNLVDCVELQPHLAAGLEAAGLYNRIFNMDFLKLRPETTGLYDIVAMNPPFDRERDIDHVIHALKFVKPGGQLAAIMSAGTEFRETKKAVAFRALVQQLGGTFEDLPANSFSEVGTNVNTCIVRIRTKAAQ